MGIASQKTENDTASSLANRCPGSYHVTVAALQTLLLPDPRPLDERLGADFFRSAPPHPGVYLMRGKDDQVLYVGKAKNLKQRLNHYRLANPDRMARRHLRLVRQVVRIELQLCSDEAAALAQEAKLLRELKPKFNRAGVWPGKTTFVAWRFTANKIELQVITSPSDDWQHAGPLNGAAVYLTGTLARLLWLAANPAHGVQALPAGWLYGQFPEQLAIICPAFHKELSSLLPNFFHEDGEKLLPWLGQQLAERRHPFEQKFIELEMEALKQFQTSWRKKRTAAMPVQ